MEFFDRHKRTICTRGLILSEQEMNNFRIKAIFNSYGDPDYLNDIDAETMLRNFIRQGEFCLLETSNNGKIYKICILTFEVAWSRNIYALSNWKYYEMFPDLLTLYN